MADSHVSHTARMRAPEGQSLPIAISIARDHQYFHQRGSTMATSQPGLQCFSEQQFTSGPEFSSVFRVTSADDLSADSQRGRSLQMDAGILCEETLPGLGTAGQSHSPPPACRGILKAETRSSPDSFHPLTPWTRKEGYWT